MIFYKARKGPEAQLTRHTVKGQQTKIHQTTPVLSISSAVVPQPDPAQVCGAQHQLCIYRGISNTAKPSDSSLTLKACRKRDHGRERKGKGLTVLNRMNEKCECKRTG